MLFSTFSAVRIYGSSGARGVARLGSILMQLNHCLLAYPLM